MSEINLGSGPNLSPDLWPEEGIAILEVNGQGLTHDTALQFGEEIDRAIHNADVWQIVIDCKLLEGIDSTGLGMLVGGRRRAEDAGKTFVLRHPGEHMAKVLRITGLNETFKIEDAT